MCRMGFLFFNIEMPPTIHECFLAFTFHNAIRVTLNLFNDHPFRQSPIPNGFNNNEPSVYIFREDVEHAFERRRKKERKN